ncbi:MAG: LptF/LptG family permease [Candidatus Margulisiibacteriota bacterium]
MKLLDFYVVREIIFPFIFGILAFTAIIAGSSLIFQLVSKAVKYGFGVSSTIQLFIYKLPAIISLTLPMAILLATILVIGRLSSDLEILALRSAGVSLFRILIPILSIGLIVSLLNIIFNEIVVPTSNYHSQLLLNKLRNTSVAIKENVNLTQYDKEGLPLRIINVREVENEILKDITIAEYADGRLARVIRAEFGEWDPSVGWIFNNGIMHVLLEQSSQELMVINFEKEIINLSINLLDFTQNEKEYDEMNARELKLSIQKEKLLGKNVNESEIQYYLKFALPFACLIFTMIGSAVSFQPHRRSSAMGMGLSIIIILTYYIIYSLGLALGINNVISPLFAAWIPNILIGIVSLVLLNKSASQ